MKRIIALMMPGLVIVLSPVMADPSVFVLHPTDSDCLNAVGDASTDGPPFLKVVPLWSPDEPPVASLHGSWTSGTLVV